jgi:hypothetical protein
VIHGNLTVQKSFLKAVRDVFDVLKGRWRLVREITPGGKMMGKAVFTECDKGVLDYIETGKLTLENGEVLDFSKAYQYRLNATGDIDIYFADGVTKGVLFQTLKMNDSGQAQAKHFCDPDHYQSRYNFEALPDRINITHKVTGPKKDYISTTSLTRCGAKE